MAEVVVVGLDNFVTATQLEIIIEGASPHDLNCQVDLRFQGTPVNGIYTFGRV